MRIFVTGGAGFIGSALVRHLIRETGHEVLVYDALTYAGTLTALAPVANDPRYRFVRGDIRDGAAVTAALHDFRPDIVTHLAAESHVDRSIDGPAAFVDTNIVGTFTMLSAARTYWQGLDAAGRTAFRFHHISTDEVFGSLGPTGRFNEDTPYDPRSPYAASKAASDHLVGAWGHTYGLPVLVTNCSNNYGPYHFPEKLIPLTILNALAGRKLPVYGKGENIRDWLYVGDHCSALRAVLDRGRIGETYNIGGNSEKTNLNVVKTLCRIIDELRPAARPRESLLTFVKDRPGHDRRYALDAGKLARELGWQPQERFESGMRKTVTWYLDNPQWIERVVSGEYRNWLATNYGKR